MAWIVLCIAGFFEIIWAFYMKQSEGFTRLVPTIITLIPIPVIGTRRPASTLSAVASVVVPPVTAWAALVI